MFSIYQDYDFAVPFLGVNPREMTANVCNQKLEIKQIYIKR
jgi:hypothetical protein